ncbi:hypothetical protein QUB56_13095 [Microcoleus sp. AR_TQ3_B6]|uniref:ISAzo13-like element transposase-related protein n=1 Tax=Microcoleus sp. AR_TQ3_B6 TaxID=3055284 RepID=UPI002FCF90A9
MTHKEIASGLRSAGFTISLPLVAKLLKKHGYVKRKAQKKQTIGSNKNRNAQFKILRDLIQSIEKPAILSYALTPKINFRKFVSSGNSLYKGAYHYFRS